jgi:redox-sensitive bicupin YhaK (pirin superfamily)
METIVHRASGRGRVQQGWHTTIHQFSFADFADPERMAFGLLRVLDDNILKPSKGFEMHSHENMEIVTIPLEGSLEHRDTMGYGSVIRKHDVQIMSAGTGVYHSEFNHSHTEDVRFLQLWVQSRERSISPRYEQMTFLPETLHNRFQILLSPKDTDGSLWINQECYISMGSFDKGRHVHYSLYEKNNGIYLFVIEGKCLVEKETLNACDGIGIFGTSSLGLEFKEASKILLVEVPMH